MFKYTIRRLLQMIPIFLLATMMIFFIVKSAPGDPFAGMLGPRTDPRKIEEARHRLHLDDPIPVQYWYWITGAAKGNLGESYQYKSPVAPIIAQRLGPTISLNFVALLIDYLLGIPIGILASRRQHSWVDQSVIILAFAGISIPPFFLGLLMLKAFSLGALRIFPSHGFMTAGSSLTGLPHLADIAQHLALPALALGLTYVAGTMMYMRSSMLEVLRQDYVRTAQAKGLSERIVIYKHALRNALMPIVTMLGFAIPGLFAGAIITETMFTWPGIGRLMYSSILARDYPVVLALLLMFAVLTMIGNLLADIGYALVDPRIRYD
ncbi:MAG: ABC transporter permease [Mycobacterium leprae]